MKKVLLLLALLTWFASASPSFAKTEEECTATKTACIDVCTTTRNGLMTAEAITAFTTCSTTCATAGDACITEAKTSFASQPFSPSEAGKTPDSPPATTDYGYKQTASESGLPNIGKSLPDIIGITIKSALGLVATIFFVLMVYGGFLWMTAAGGGEQVGQAKKLITQALLGITVIAGAYAIVTFVIGAVT